MKRFSFLVFKLWFTIPCGFSQVLIKAPDTSNTEFIAYTQVEHTTPYAEYMINTRRASPKPVDLMALLKKSQAEFLSYNPLSSVPTYQKIIENRHAFDWNEGDRKIIVYAFFRLAQLETDENKKSLFLQEAIGFDSQVKLDFNLFPPPLIKAYLQIKKTIKWVSVDLKTIFPHHEWVLINGKKYSSLKKIQLVDGFYRVSAFSSSYRPWEQTLPLPLLLKKKVQTHSLVKGGNCQRAVLADFVLDDETLWVLFPHFCIWKEARTSYQKVQKKRISKIMKEYKPVDMPFYNDHFKKNLSPPPPKKSHKTLWLVLGGVVLVGAAVWVWHSTSTSPKLQNPPPPPAPPPAPPPPAPPTTPPPTPPPPPASPPPPPPKPVITIGF